MKRLIKNFFAPAVIDLFYLLNIEQPHFFTHKEKPWRIGG
jgi:hypothetical protein